MAIQQGLGGLMPQAPMAGQPVDPRMGAALDVVGADELAEKTDMPLATAALMKRNEALELLKSAENDERAAQFQAPPNPSINDQVNQGLAGMLRSMMPGQALRGRQVQQARARKMLGPMSPQRAPQMAAGLPGLPATNMRRMAANGGVIGYAPGGDVEAEDTGFLAGLRKLDEGLKADEAERQAERMARGRRASDYIPVPGGGSYYLPVKNLIYDIGQGVSGLANLMKRKPEEKEEPVDVNALFLSVYDDYTKALESGNEERIARASELVNSFDETTRREALQSVQQNKMMGGKVKGYAGPDGSLVTGDSLEEEVQRLLGEQVEPSGYTGPSAAERRESLTEDNAKRRSMREEERKFRTQLATRGLNVSQINKIVEQAYQDPETGSFSMPQPIDPSKVPSREATAPDALDLLDTGAMEARAKYKAIDRGPTYQEYLPNADPSTLPRGGTGEEARAPAPQSFPAQLPENFQSDIATVLERSKGLMALDEEADARRVSDRLAEIMGPTREAQESRRQAQEESRRLRETEFTPEAMRFNRLRAALERGGREGLGGFGAGERAEADRLLKAQIESSDKTAAEFDALVKEMQAMGLNEFQAEEAARQGIRDQVQTGMTVTEAINKTLADIAVSEADRAQRQAAQELQAQTSLDVARIQGDVQLAVANLNKENTEFGRSFRTLRNQAAQDNPNLSAVELDSMALERLFDQEIKAQMAKIGVSEQQLQQSAINDSIRAAADVLANDPSTFGQPELRQQKILELAERIRNQYGTSTTGGQPNASQIQALIANPQRRAEFDEKFGQGAAARFLGQ